MKIKSVIFNNRKKELVVSYSNNKEFVVHFSDLNIRDNILNAWIDKETDSMSIGIELQDGTIEYMPYDQPLALNKDPEYVLQNHIENLVAKINKALNQKKISKGYLARRLNTSDNQIQRLLSPQILNKNLTQLYKIASLLEIDIELKAA